MTTLDQEIKRRVESFKSDIAAIAAKHAAAELSSAMNGKRVAVRAKGTKRTPGDMIRVMEEVRRFIAKNPDSNMEEISKGMNAHSTELTLPVQKLIAAKRLSKKGQKRATRYRLRGAA